MRKVILEYVEVLNETEQLFIFTTIFNGQSYGNTLLLNTALTIKNQDKQIVKTIKKLESMNRQDAKESA